MRLILIRHAKVLFDWEKNYNAAEFNTACNGYSDAAIFSAVGGKIKTGEIPVFISELKRTEATARLIFEKQSFIKNALFNEVELRAFTPSKRRLPTLLWKAVGRSHWFLNWNTQPEIRKETIIRAKEAISLLEEQQRDVILVSHGIFLQVMIRELSKQGYSIKRNGKIWLDNLDMVVAQKE